MAVNDDFLDAQTSHQIGIQRLSNATVRKIVALIRRSDARLFERLLQEDVTALSRARQEKLLVELRRIVDSVYVDATGRLQIDLDGLAAYEGEYQRDMFRRVLPVRFETVLPSADLLIAAVNSRPFQGKLLKETYKDLSASAQRRVRDTVRAGIVEGRTTAQIVQDLRGTRAQGFKDGTLEHNRRATEAVVRTAVNHTANAARERMYAANNALIKGVQYNATLDGRTTAVCRGLDGQIFEVGKGPRPPMHYGCRSTTSPVIRSWQELGFDVGELPEATRASLNGQVAAGLTYDEWLRKQPRKFQDEVLGRRKGELFRGGLKLDRFTNRLGDEYTLDELRRREREIWERTAE